MIGAEEAVIASIQQGFPTALVQTETPADLVGNLPFIKVVAVGGGRTLALGAPTIDYECYGPDRQSARTLAGQVDDWCMFQMHGLVGGSVISAVRTVSLPAFRPYDNTNVRRYGGTLQVFLRDAVTT